MFYFLLQMDRQDENNVLPRKVWVGADWEDIIKCWNAQTNAKINKCKNSITTKIICNINCFCEYISNDISISLIKMEYYRWTLSSIFK